MLPGFYLSLHELLYQSTYKTQFCQVSFVHLLVINRNIRILTMGRDATKSMGRVLTHCLLSLCFARGTNSWQSDPFAMYKIGCECKLLVCDFLKNLRKVELADDIAKRCQRYIEQIFIKFQPL